MWPVLKNRRSQEFFRRLYQQKWARGAVSIFLVLGIPFLGAYSYFLAPRRVRVDRHKLKLRNTNFNKLKLAQISDLHFGPTNKSDKHFHNIVDRINLLSPDLIVLTGDFFQWDPDYLHKLAEILGRLRAPLGVWACFGNHDYGSCYSGEQKNDPFDFKTIRDVFLRYKIQFLANESRLLEYQGQSFYLVGLHDLWSGLFNPTLTLQTLNSVTPTFILSHNPDTALLIEQEFDLMLSGHAHGGQVSWPYLGSMNLPLKNKHLHRGWHQISPRKHLYVNRGLGHTFRMRLNSPPEITLIEIQ